MKFWRCSSNISSAVLSTFPRFCNICNKRKTLLVKFKRCTNQILLPFRHVNYLKVSMQRKNYRLLFPITTTKQIASFVHNVGEMMIDSLRIKKKSLLNSNSTAAVMQWLLTKNNNTKSLTFYAWYAKFKKYKKRGLRCRKKALKTLFWVALFNFLASHLSICNKFELDVRVFKQKQLLCPNYPRHIISTIMQ